MHKTSFLSNVVILPACVSTISYLRLARWLILTSNSILCVEYRVGTFVSNRLIQVSQDGVLTNMALNVGIEIKVAAFHCRSSLKDDSHKLDRQAIAYLAFLTSDSVPQFPDAVIDWFSIASYDKVQLKETVARTS